MVQNLTNFATSLPDELGIMFLSMIPVTELRASIPIFVTKGMEPVLAYIMAVIGNLIPVPFILGLARPIFNWMKKRAFLAKLVNFLDKKVNSNKESVLKYKFWGLAIFVAIPLPGTGAWTGAFVAAMLDMRFKKALPSITIGVLIAGLIITLISTGVLSFLGFLLG